MVQAKIKQIDKAWFCLGQKKTKKRNSCLGRKVRNVDFWDQGYIGINQGPMDRHPKAAVFGFPGSEAGPKPCSGRDFGLA